jgi:hypothetical protein
MSVENEPLVDSDGRNPEPVATDQAPAPTPAPPAVTGTVNVDTPATNQSLQELLRREASLREQESALKEQRREVEDAKSLTRLAREDFGEFLRRTGLNADQVKQHLDGSKPDPVQGLQGTVEQLQQKIAAFEQAQAQTQQQQREQQVWGEQTRKVQAFLTQNAESFPLSAKAGMHENIVGVQRSIYQKTGKFLSEAEVARETEQYLQELQKHLVGAPAEPSGEDQEPPTFSNQSTQSVGDRSSSADYAISNEDWLRQNYHKLIRN